jgi:hypothetical protein
MTDSISQTFICPITHEIMEEPVIDNEGNSYDNYAITNWLENNNTSPITRNYLHISHLKPNRALTEAIQIFKSNTKNTNSENNSVQNNETSIDFNQIKFVNHFDGIKNILEIEVPDSDEREPINLMCILDTSSSMNVDADLPDSQEKTDRTILDLSVHTIKTIVKNMNERDYFGFVTFSNYIKDELNGYKKMDIFNKSSIITKLETLRAQGRTNLWGGLQKGIEILSEMPLNNSKHCIIFTDGIPNVHPPRSYNNMVERYITQKFPDINVHTIGFGYNIESNILDNDISNLTKGFYSYIPDAGFIGTVILNLMSNIYTCCGKNGVLKVNNKFYEINNLYYGQKIHKEIDANIEGQELNIELSFQHRQQSVICEKNIEVSLFYNPKISITQIRTDIIHLLTLLIENNYTPELNNLVKEKIEEFNNIIECYQLEDNEIIQNMIKDVKGQILEGASSENYYKRWGENYFRALRTAYINEIKNNFKDFGIQHYGGKLFNKLLDEFEDIFMKSEIKKTYRPPQYNQTRTYAPPISATRYYDNSGGCFAGHCTISTNNGKILVKDLKKNDLVLTPQGYAKVICLVETKGSFETCKLYSGLEITKYHPIFINEWIFPIDYSKTNQITNNNIVYNLIIDKDHSVFINNIQVCTLGHNLTDNDVIKHEYFGTNQVINDYQKIKGYIDGKIIIKQNMTARNRTTGFVCGLC